MASITSILVRKIKWKFMGKHRVSKACRSINYNDVKYICIYMCFSNFFSSYKRNKIFTAITWFLIIITGGLLRLVFHWIPHLMLLVTHSKCQLENADTVLLVERFQGKHTSYHVKKLKALAAEDIL